MNQDHQDLQMAQGKFDSDDEEREYQSWIDFVNIKITDFSGLPPNGSSPIVT